ncbi:sodium:proton antiporter [Paenibacillus filicis]|uniref:Sodium:proton antiporter n=1 Tax=Paenibacillus gyeongsangnamensis TaxID=3388067 RepID=A0ABT4QAW1_9BACL|nr:Na+/H+ antiporter NhaC family protein [Paenibacillus filicis]MCZ8514020.1 sodium:proton antiporter [Paenibacillus filicis]
MVSSWLSLLPFAIVIPAAIFLKEIMPGLVLGLLVGSFSVQPSLLGGLQQSIQYILKTLTHPDNVKIMSFLYLFGALVGIMQISGGIKGFVEWVGERVKSNRALMTFIWLTIPFTFFTPMFRIMIIAPVMKSILEKMSLPKERVAYILDISTEPVIVLMPIATAFVGFMTSVVAGATEQNQLGAAPYRLFLSSLPFNFFAWTALAYGLFSTFRNPGRRSEVHRDERKQEEGNDLHGLGIKKELSLVQPELWHFILPLFALLVLTLLLLWEDGRERGAVGVLSALSHADATLVMLLSVFISLLLTIGYYLLRRQPLRELMYHFFQGGNEMMTPVILLVLVWALSMAAKDLGFSAFVSSVFGGVLPGFTIPAVIFLAGSLVSYFIGTSWGTWGLMMPLGVVLAVATGAPLSMTVGAVFASGTFGAFASPIGDTTITTASVMEMGLVDYARYKLKAALMCAGISLCMYLGFAYIAGR